MYRGYGWHTRAHVKSNPVDNGKHLATAVLERYGRELHRYLVRHLHRTQDAGDLAQEVYLRLLRLEKSELVRQPNAYVFFIAAQVVSQFKLRTRSEPIVYDSDIAQERTENPSHFRPDELGDHLQAQRQLEKFLAELPPTHRDVLLLRRRDGLSWAEIARALGLSVHTVKKYLHEARARLRLMEWP
jgi:RNA polymerase sigma-19 factor, ECF subfamily